MQHRADLLGQIAVRRLLVREVQRVRSDVGNARAQASLVTTKLRGLIFDFDGTIAETERFGQRVAYNRAFADLNLDWIWDEVLYADLLSVAGGKERLRYYLARYRPDLLDGAVKEGLIVDIHRAKVRNFARIAACIPLRLGIARLFYEAHFAGVRIAIATTASRPGVEALLAQDSALLPMIDVIAANEDVERKKPAPDVYLRALELLRLDADQCVAIEDSQIGLQAAIAAALRTVVTISDYTTSDDFTGAAAVLSDLGERDRPARCVRGLAPPSGIADLAFMAAILAEAASAT